MPQPAGLSEASAAIESLKGTIKSSFRKTASEMELKVTVQAATNAIVGVPASGVKRVKLKGKMVWKDGRYLVKTLSPKLDFPKRIAFELVSGEWQFHALY